MTNAERIRAMSDEELANTLAQDWCDTVCGDKNACSYCDGKCEQHICNWLRQEVSNDIRAYVDALRAYSYCNYFQHDR